MAIKQQEAGKAAESETEATKRRCSGPRGLRSDSGGHVALKAALVSDLHTNRANFAWIASSSKQSDVSILAKILNKSGL